MRKSRKPTEAELAILQVLWARGPSTVREVARELDREGAYTTVLKHMQIMTDKRLVTRDESARSHVYQSALSEQHTQQKLVADLLNRVFDGSAARLLMQVLASKKASQEELDQIEALIKKERGGRR